MSSAVRAVRPTFMPQSTSDFHRQLIKNAEILFKLAFGFTATQPKLRYLSAFSFYRHTAKQNELKLTKRQEFKGGGLLEHVATYTLAVQIDTALGELFPNRFASLDAELRSMAWIARLIRNAFAHNPFAPKWLIDRKAKNQRFAVRDIVYLNTTGLERKYVTRRDYGGPFALLRFSHLVRRKLPRTQSARLSTQRVV